MHAIRVFAEIDQAQHCFLVNVRGNRKLHQNAVYVHILIKRSNGVLNLFLSAVFGKQMRN